MRSAWFAGILLVLVACEVSEPAEVQLAARFVREGDFCHIQPGMTREQVLAALGAPEKKEQPADETWTYGVWRGEAPGFWTLLQSRPPAAVILDGRVHFRHGTVVSREVVESSAVQLSEALSRRAPAAPSSSPASE